MLIDSNVQCVADVHAVLGEGPVWVEREGALYWVDIEGRKIFRLRPDGERDEWPTPLRVGSIAPRSSGGFIAGTDRGIAVIELNSGTFEIIHHPEDHLPGNRFNDGKVDRRGRFWAGTMDDSQRAAQGSLYRIDADYRCTRFDEQYRITNGPAFSPEGDRMYHNDSARRVTYVFELDGEGNPGERRLFAQYGGKDGHPDGMTVDSEGHLWIAFWGGWCIRRYSPDGRCVGTIEVPVEQPSSCAFGGSEMDRLYISSARTGLDEAALELQPQAGGLFVAAPGVRGIAELPFAG